ncbi:MAG: hypothetical protein C4532_19840 [Candidatus Abyssobacteria bacterium SURF_17]|uniref:Plasmid pRiA4b Orf3-like domain-containing protein n=1 Tax=Candidatus Abyssobacteria bacterium SURF_17 TaxID=2093361 RepID=A0A419EN64_9BACT|nr:MAG: hypothetical protein C4532_19840 [Candidatus Abyssubacteria bacterium SURF_17]
MARTMTKGACMLCNANVSKAGMTKHLAACVAKEINPGRASDTQKATEGRIFHLIVEGRDQPQYWMHLEMPHDATLKKLDSFLRDKWLECCGHLSAFTFQNERYASHPSPDFDRRGMNATLGKVLTQGMKFYHEYDFGTTTDLVIKVVGERQGKMKGTVRLLAVNDPPLIPCGTCGKEAVHVCSECVWSSDKAWLCEECAEQHECGEDMLLPVVNSPRVGMCGYTGP